MAEARVTCIKKLTSNGSHEHITHVGVNGRTLTKDEVIRLIDSKTFTFYVQDTKTGKRANVGVVRPDSGQPYLRTYADGYWNDNLLSLLECY